MNRHERQVACRLLRDHFGEGAVGECAEPPYIVIWKDGKVFFQLTEQIAELWKDVSGVDLAQGLIQEDIAPPIIRGSSRRGVESV